VKAVEAAPRDLAANLALVRFYADYTFRVSDGGLFRRQGLGRLAPDNARSPRPAGLDVFPGRRLAAGPPAPGERAAPGLIIGQRSLSPGAAAQRPGEKEAARFAFMRPSTWIPRASIETGRRPPCVR